MRPSTTNICLVLAILVLSLPAAAQDLPTASPQEVGFSADGLSAVRPAMQKCVDEEKVAGAVAIIARRGKVVAFEAVGMMDVEAGRPMRRDTIFRIYSMTKPITSVAVMMLVEEGKIALDDPVWKHIPQFKGLKVLADPDAEEIVEVAQEREVTVRDLLRHTAGLTYGHFSSTAVDKMLKEARKDAGPEADLKSLVDTIGRLPLVYQPGTRWHYSLATDVLGHLVEVVSEQTLDVFFAKRIFRPLGMKDTAFYVSPKKLDRLATNYGPKLIGGLAAIDRPATSKYAKPPAMLSGGGGLVSTVDDYMRFCLMLQGEGQLGGQRLLKPQTVKMMTANQLPDVAMPVAFGDAKRHGVGFGLGVSVRVRQSDWEADSRVGEYGWGGAASTHFWISPADGLVVIVLSQHMPYNDRLERALKPIVYDAIVD